VEPPGAQGTINVMGLVGFHCANAGVASKAANIKANTGRRVNFMTYLHWVKNHCGEMTPQFTIQLILERADGLSISNQI
jgi:hypothetical protein